MNKIVLAGCVILDNEGKVLLLHRNTPKRVQWETPGGKIEEGEIAEQAAEREAEEELGVDIKIIKELGEKEFLEDEHTMDYTWYLVKIKSGTPKIMEKDKFDQLKYFSWDELSQMKDLLSPNAKNLVEAYFSKQISVIDTKNEIV